jgi:hypothetical protein
VEEDQGRWLETTEIEVTGWGRPGSGDDKVQLEKSIPGHKHINKQAVKQS